jgi:hypothetical protein
MAKANSDRGLRSPGYIAAFAAFINKSLRFSFSIIASASAASISAFFA